jgi:hypothetical protein
LYTKTLNFSFDVFKPQNYIKACKPFPKKLSTVATDHYYAFARKEGVSYAVGQFKVIKKWTHQFLIYN